MDEGAATTTNPTSGGVVVELMRSVRHGDYAWTFDREVVPSSLGGGGGGDGGGGSGGSGGSGEEGSGVVVPIRLWRITCDRVVALHESHKERCVPIFKRRMWARLLEMLPLGFFLIFCVMICIWWIPHLFSDSVQDDNDDDEYSQFMWQAWLAIVVALPVCKLLSWLVTRLYMKPALLGLEHEWEGLAQELQNEYSQYGVQVRVKRVSAVVSYLVHLMPDGLISCGLVLELPGRENGDLPEQAQDMPRALVVTGVPLDTWAYTVGQCVELHKNQVARLKAAAQSVRTFTNALYYIAVVCFGAAPFIAWACGWTNNDQIGYIFIACCLFILAVPALECLHLRYYSRLRTEWNECDDAWRALSEQTESVWAQYHVAVTVQRRSSPLLRANPALKTAFTSILGSADRAVGLSFRTADEAVVSIEYGKVDVGDDEKHQQQMGDNEADVAVLKASLV